MRRSYWFAAIAALGLILAADAAYWWLVVGQLRQSLALWEAKLRDSGWQIGSGPAAAGGWPLEARLTIPNPTLRHRGPAPPGIVNVAAPDIALSVPLWHPTDLRLPIASPVHLMAEGLPDTILSAETMAITAHLNAGDGTPPVVFKAHDLRVEPADGGWHAAAGDVVFDTDLNPPVAADPHKDAAFMLSARNVVLPGAVKWALGQAVDSLSLRGSLEGTLPAAPSVTPWVAAWRDNGGSLDIAQYGLTWGPLRLSGSAKLALDAQLQPAGTATAHVVGYAAALDRLAAAGIMTRSAATAATAVLSLMAGMGDGTMPAAVDVPLTLQSRTLSIRQIPLVRLPELDWPAGQ